MKFLTDLKELGLVLLINTITNKFIIVSRFTPVEPYCIRPFGVMLRKINMEDCFLKQFDDKAVQMAKKLNLSLPIKAREKLTGKEYKYAKIDDMFVNNMLSFDIDLNHMMLAPSEYYIVPKEAPQTFLINNGIPRRKLMRASDYVIVDEPVHEEVEMTSRELFLYDPWKHHTLIQ